MKEIYKLKLKDGTILKGVIKDPYHMTYSHGLNNFFGLFVDKKLQMGIAESEVAEIFYGDTEPYVSNTLDKDDSLSTKIESSFRYGVEQIADNFVPDDDDQAPLALSEMREALKNLLTNSSNLASEELSPNSCFGPYVYSRRVVIERLYNPDYGDARICTCGHPYYRHFDPFENNFDAGCKYCECYNFVEQENKIKSQSATEIKEIKEIKEGYVCKGGVNKRPTTLPPPPPIGQGGKL